MASQDARLSVVEQSIAALVESQRQMMELMRGTLTAPQSAPVPSAPKVKADKPATDPKAEWSKTKRALKTARKTAIAEHGSHSAEAINATIAYRDCFIAGFNAGYWTPITATADLTSFWESTVNGAWAKLSPNTVPVVMAPAKKSPSMPVNAPTERTAIANVDKSAHMQRVQASRGYCPSCRGFILLGKDIDPSECVHKYNTPTGRVQFCKSIPRTDATTAPVLVARKAVNLDENDAASEADRVAAFMQTLSPAMREQMMSSASAMEF